MISRRQLFLVILALSSILVFPSCSFHIGTDATNETVPPTPTETTTATVTATPIPTATPTSYTPAQFKEYFYQIALGTEFYSQTNRIRKWQEPLTLEVKGTPTAEDTATLNAIIAEISQLTGGQAQIKIVPSGGNSKLWFAPLSDLPKYEPHIIKDNWGFFYCTWDDNYYIYTTNIVIASDKPTQKERDHLIREELTQSLGLMQDSDLYPDSIFYIEWTDGQQYSDLDEAVIKQLYEPEVKAGMTQAELETIMK